MYDCNLTLAYRNAGSYCHQFVEKGFAHLSASETARGSVLVAARPAGFLSGSLSGTCEKSFQHHIAQLTLLARESDAYK
jgi:hypothetical protein